MSGWDSAHWHWPQVVILVFYALILCVSAALNGQDKPQTKHNFPSKLCDAAIVLCILWYGGFFA